MKIMKAVLAGGGAEGKISDEELRLLREQHFKSMAVAEGGEGGEEGGGDIGGNDTGGGGAGGEPIPNPWAQAAGGKDDDDDWSD